MTSCLLAHPLEASHRRPLPVCKLKTPAEALAFYPDPDCVHVQVIAPEEIIDPSVDEQSVMTYLSQFPKAKLKPGAPLKPKLNPKKARAYGAGKGGGVVRRGDPPRVVTSTNLSS